MKALKAKKYTPRSRTGTLLAFINKYPAIVTLFGTVILFCIGVYVFYLRYPFSFDAANFYAEDGKNFMANLIEKGPVEASLTFFNGYLIVGQYLVGIFAELINIFRYNGSFEHLPQSIALASYGFLSLVCVLPWLLFRKRLGSLLSIIAVMLLWATPLGGYDYAVIGTIGNLKFAFLFIATLLVIYRNDPTLCKSLWQFIIIDVMLLLCVATNIVTVGLLPLILLRYRSDITLLFHRKLSVIGKLLKNPSFVSVLVIAIISAAYLLVVYTKGVPKLPGYLDGPIDKSGLGALIYRATTYSVLFPLNQLITALFAALSLVFVAFIALINKQRWTVLLIAYASILNIVGFVYNRPGVTSYFSTPNDSGWPGHFFYAGTMLFVFGLVIMAARNFNTLSSTSKYITTAGVALLIAIVMPATGYTKTNTYGASTPSVQDQLMVQCKVTESSRSPVTLTIYPTNAWTMTLPRDNAC